MADVFDTDAGALVECILSALANMGNGSDITGDA